VTLRFEGGVFSRRRRHVVLGGGAILLAATIVASAVLLLSENDERAAEDGSQAAAKTGGPIRPTQEGWSISVSAPSSDVPYTHAGLMVTNPTSTAITLDQVELVDADAGLNLVGSLAGKRRGVATINYPGFPPRGVAPWIEGQLRPLKGYQIAPSQQAQVFIGLDVDEDGRHIFRSLRLFYMYKGTRYQADFPIGFALCTPVPRDADCAPLEPID
jgi:hypothetical protein